MLRKSFVNTHIILTFLLLFNSSFSLFASIACPQPAVRFCNVCVKGTLTANTGIINNLIVNSITGAGISVSGARGVTGPTGPQGVTGVTGPTGPFDTSSPITFSNMGNVSGCTGGFPAVTVLGGQVIGGNLGVGGNATICGIVDTSNINHNGPITVNSNWIYAPAATFDSTTIQNGVTYVLEGDRTTGMIINNVEGVTIFFTGIWTNAGGTPLTVQNSTEVKLYNYHCELSGDHGFVFLNAQNCTMDNFTINNWFGSAILCYAGSSHNSISNGSCTSSDVNPAGVGILHVDCVGCQNSNIYVYGVQAAPVGPGYTFETKDQANGVVFTNCVAENCAYVVAMGNPDGPTGSLNCAFNNCVGKDCKCLYIEGPGCSNNFAIVSGNVLSSVSGGIEAVRFEGNANSEVIAHVTMGDTAKNLVRFDGRTIGNKITVTSPSANVVMAQENGSANNVIIYEGPNDENSISTVNFTGSNNRILKIVRPFGDYTDTFYGCLAGAGMPFGFTGALNDTAFGYQALQNVTGSNNSAFGARALVNLHGGLNNIAIGSGAGSVLTTNESNNIYIGNVGVAAESNAIRIGTSGTQTTCSIAGIFGNTVTNTPVLINSAGQLGTVASSRKYKKDIKTLDMQREKMVQLRPVSFVYKQDPHHNKQCGLIAEEVSEVYPDLIVHDEGGEIYTVNYLSLIPLLLKHSQELEDQLQMHQTQLTQLYATLNALKQKIKKQK